jgi:formylmethanofuran dehydrogenase subunit E
MRKLTIDPATVDLAALVERGTRVHGHLGPFLVAGIRMGLLALELLGSPGYFGIRAESGTGLQTPLSCLTDGIQVGSGCTTGKGNLFVFNDRVPRGRFFADDGGAVEITVRPEVLDDFRRGEIRAESLRTMTRPVEELFTWTILSSSSTP